MTRQIIGCRHPLPTWLLVNLGKAGIEVRRQGMSPGKGAGDLELEVKDVP